MKKCFFLILFMLSRQYSWSQDPAKMDIALLKKTLAQSKPDTNRISIQLQLCHYYTHLALSNYGEAKGNLDNANKFVDDALALSTKLNDTGWYYKALEKKAFCYYQAGDPERCKKSYLLVIAWYHQKGNTAKEADVWQSLAEWYHYNDTKYVKETISYLAHSRWLYLEINQPLPAADILGQIADEHLLNKQFDTANNEYLQVLKEYKACGYTKLEHVYRSLCSLEYDRGNFYRAMAVCLEAIKFIKTKKDTSYCANFYAETARCNYAAKKYTESLEWIRKALVIDKMDANYICVLVQNLIALNKTNDARMALNGISMKDYPWSFQKLDIYRTFALYYNKINGYEMAVQYYNQILAIFKEKGYYGEDDYNTWSVISNNEITGIYIRTKQFGKAKKYINTTASLFKNAKTALDPRFLADFYDHQYKYDVTTGNNAEAVKHLEQRVKIQDSLFTADKDKQLVELNIQYETAQKEQSIKNLQSQGIAQQVKTEKANLQRNITIAGILLMIMVSTLFYGNYKQKQAANTIISQKNDQLQHLVTEKEWLLKEVHHRVKNNLHTVIALLESQALYLQDDALKANEVSKHRIYAMSLIHQQLYKGEDIKTIDMAVFLPELLDYLSESFGTERKIQFRRDIAPIHLGVSQAIPVALIVNEAVTNSLKYAFAGDKAGIITISMVQSGDIIKLVISDNGIGIGATIINGERSSMGLNLIKGLTGEMDGQMNIINENGTTITVSFNTDPLSEFN